MELPSVFREDFLAALQDCRQSKNKRQGSSLLHFRLPPSLRRVCEQDIVNLYRKVSAYFDGEFGAQEGTLASRLIVTGSRKGYAISADAVVSECLQELEDVCIKTIDPFCIASGGGGTVSVSCS